MCDRPTKPTAYIFNPNSNYSNSLFLGSESDITILMLVVQSNTNYTCLKPMIRLDKYLKVIAC
jgi:hypothetical protein